MLRLSHALAELQQVCEQRILFFLFAKRKHLAEASCLFPRLEHLVHPQRVDFGHAQQSSRIRRGSGVEYVYVVVVFEHQIDHVFKHSGLLEGGIHGGGFDEVIGFGTDIGELEKPLNLLADFPFFSLNGLFGIDLVRPEIGGHGGGRAKYRPLQETGKAVHRIGGRQKRAFALAGEP